MVTLSPRCPDSVTFLKFSLNIRSGAISSIGLNPLIAAPCMTLLIPCTLLLASFEHVPVNGISACLSVLGGLLYIVNAQLSQRSVCWLRLCRVQTNIVLMSNGLIPYPY